MVGGWMEDEKGEWVGVWVCGCVMGLTEGGFA